MPVQSPSSFQNSPVSGTQYFAPMWSGCIPALTANPIATVKSWSGANGTGSLLVVSTFEAFVWDQTTGIARAHFSGSNDNTVNAQGSGGWGNSDWCKPSGKFTGAQHPGSFEFFLTYTGTAWVPTTPTFSPAGGAVGSSVIISGARFTDATFVQFNGLGASFTVNSDTQITATVPVGATSGPITVGNPAGSSSSSSAFVVGTAYARRSGLWVAFVPQARRSSSWTPAPGFVRRSGAWTQGS